MSSPETWKQNIDFFLLVLFRRPCVLLTSSLISLKSKGCRCCKGAWLSSESNYTWVVLPTKILCLIDHGWEQRPMKTLAKRFHPTIRCETESHQCWKSSKHISNCMSCKWQKLNWDLTLPNERFWGTLMHLSVRPLWPQIRVKEKATPEQETCCAIAAKHQKRSLRAIKRTKKEEVISIRKRCTHWPTLHCVRALFLHTKYLWIVEPKIIGLF